MLSNMYKMTNAVVHRLSVLPDHYFAQPKVTMSDLLVWYVIKHPECGFKLIPDLSTFGATLRTKTKFSLIAVVSQI